MVLLLRKTKRQNLYRIGESRSHVNAVAQENSEFGSGASDRSYCIAASMGERPQPELFLADLPEPGEAVRLDGEEEDDERAEDDHLEVRHEPRGQRDAEHAFERVHDAVEEDRQQRDEGGTHERSENAADAADDDHEQNLE